jgi:hypothetical protein
MTKNEYLENNFKAYNEGRISAEAYCAALMNIDAFCEDWEEVATKLVPDSDGFLTEYTWYHLADDMVHIFMFGDKEMYPPDQDYADYECETWNQAKEWFEHYKGFEEELK